VKAVDQRGEEKLSSFPIDSLQGEGKKGDGTIAPRGRHYLWSANQVAKKTHENPGKNSGNRTKGWPRIKDSLELSPSKMALV